ncbi:unnamed protein product [Candida verbasci]|uniref:beta-glucosidase n=1 Tax=Candida verbasci TaxID=1227364 RepID=A0A9W4TTP9_9ASCO|nr:unnamed protein product [Candida verbasci]
MNYVSLFISFYLFMIIFANDSSLNSQQQVELFTKIVSDIKLHPSDYINLFRTGDVAIPINLLGQVGQITTYTDDSYTTMIENSDIRNNLDNLATQLPWYNQRIAGDNIPSVTTSINSNSELSTTNNNSNIGFKYSSSLFGLISGFLISIICLNERHQQQQQQQQQQQHQQPTSRNRFGWVRRLMQGQNRTTATTTTTTTTTTTRNHTPHNHHHGHNSQDYANYLSKRGTSNSKPRRNENVNKITSQSSKQLNKINNNNNNNNYNLHSRNGSENYSIDNNSSDLITNNSGDLDDNVSTTPLKSIISAQSTKSPSILSNGESQNVDTSTAETSLAPSVYTSHAHQLQQNLQPHTQVTIQSPNERERERDRERDRDRDSESIVTLASSSRRIRRRSIDTNCSTAGIPPASIFERLGVQQNTAANSIYATSIKTNNDRISQIENTNHSDDQTSSIKILSMGTFYTDTSIEGDVYIQKLSSYIRKNEENLANGLLCFSKNRQQSTNLKTKPLRLTFTIHHLYYITERIDQSSLGVDVGPLNIKLDNPNHEPTFISFMANNARSSSSRHFIDSDTRSISSINSMKSIVSSASIYWRSLTNINKIDPKLIQKDIKYLYSSFTKIPCLILNSNTKVNSINGYEEYPCDTSIPIKMFKNLQVLEIVEYEPNEIFGWNILSEQLRILIIRRSKINNIGEILFNLVIDDESGRLSFNTNINNNNRQSKYFLSADDSITEINNSFKYKRDRRNTTSSNSFGQAGSLPKDNVYLDSKNYESLPETKWSFLKQLTISETNIINVPRFIFKPLTSLVKLNLSNNLLEEVPAGLDQLINVKYLNFADNYITNLKNLPNNLIQLLTLNFNNNKISDLSGLENLSSLEKIDLRKNELKELKDLKPLVSLFMKNNQNQLDNVYLIQNKLPKNYRIDLFNLFNGIRYKNNIKIDDSRPGYFEKAMLLESETAIKNLEKFYNLNKRNSVLTAETIDETNTNTLVSISPSAKQEILLESFANLKIDNENSSPKSAKFKKYDLSHTVISTSLSLLSPSTQPSSPLHANHNITNKSSINVECSLPSPLNKQTPMIHMNKSNSSIPSTPSIKRSTTLVDFEKINVNYNTAPNILTPVQVTARMYNLYAKAQPPNMICQWLLILLVSFVLSLDDDSKVSFTLESKFSNSSNLKFGSDNSIIQKRSKHSESFMVEDPMEYRIQTHFPSPVGGRLENIWQKAYERARKVVDKMSITEKVNLTTGTGWGSGPCVGNTGSVPRLGIPNLCLQDGPNGVRFTDFVTHFPSGLAAGTTFNKGLIYLRGKAIGKEFKKKGIHVCLGPTIGPIGLKVNGGRNWESFGSDPYLQGIMGAATVEGIQDEGVIAVARHLIGNEQEHFRQIGEWDEEIFGQGWDKLENSISSNIGDRAMHEIYLWPFANVIKAGCGAIMCSYNQLNNSYCCENSYLINYLLKEELSFQGFVMSDWGAQHTGVNSALSGLDMTMPGEIFDDWLTGKSLWGPLLTRAVYNGTIPQQRLNDMCTRIIATFFAIPTVNLPLEDDVPNFSSWTHHTFGQEFPYQHFGPILQKNWHIDARSEFSDNTALTVARESVVLLKNSGHNIPIDKSDGVRRLLIVGKGAFADPNGFNCKDQRCTNGLLSSGWGSAAVNNPYVITPYEAIAKKARERGILIDYNFNNWDLDHMEDLADYSDLSIVFVNSFSGEGYIYVENNFGDRQNSSLWHNGDEIIEKIANKCHKTIVVISSTGPINMEKWIEHENVVGVIWTPPLGQFVGQAIADVLFGDTNPSGKLPFTIARKKQHYVSIIDELNGEKNPQDNFDRDIYLDYRFFDKHNIKPRFEFGYGLSFTSFKVCNLKITEINSPSEYLPYPQEYLPLTKIVEDDVCDPEDALFPHDEFDPAPGYIYPYLYNENTRSLDEDETFDYPQDYNPDQPNNPPLSGGGLGGNPTLWEILYEVSVEVKNEGKLKGGYVCQLYIEFPNTILSTPPKQLRGFEKIFLEPGSSQVLNFNILHRDLSIWDPESQQWIIQTGTYKIFIASSSRKVELCGEIDIGC